jgi:hypothetical protein
VRKDRKKTPLPILLIGGLTDISYPPNGPDAFHFYQISEGRAKLGL